MIWIILWVIVSVFMGIVSAENIESYWLGVKEPKRDSFSSLEEYQKVFNNYCLERRKAAGKTLLAILFILGGPASTVFCLGGAILICIIYGLYQVCRMIGFVLWKPKKYKDQHFSTPPVEDGPYK